MKYIFLILLFPLASCQQKYTGEVKFKLPEVPYADDSR